MRPSSNLRRLSRAFTLIEMMIVIVILSLAVAVTYPKLSGGLIERERLRASANQLAAFAGHGRDLAAAKQQSLVLSLDTDSGAYRLADDSQNDTPVADGPGEHGSLAEGVEFLSVRLIARDPEPGSVTHLRFTSQGWADPAVIQLRGADGAIYSIVITAPAGQVETYDSAISGNE